MEASKEPNWDEWKKTLGANFLHKPQSNLDQLQLKESYDQKGWDTITLTTDELHQISQITNPYIQEDPNYFNLKYVALRKIKFIFREETYYFSVISSNMLHIRIWEQSPELQRFSVDCDIKVFPNQTGHALFELKNVNSNSAVTKFLREEDGDSGLYNYETMAMLFLLLNCFFFHFKDVAFKVKEIQCQGPSRKVQYPHSTVETRTIRLVNQYKLRKNWQVKVERKKTEIQCQAWGVRGHFRHYKNGKVVFVRPYVKGKQREEYKGKIYQLLPKGENSI